MSRPYFFSPRNKETHGLKGRPSYGTFGASSPVKSSTKLGGQVRFAPVESPNGGRKAAFNWASFSSPNDLTPVPSYGATGQAGQA